MEKYSKAVSEMYSQFKKFEAHPMGKYIGRLANCRGIDCEVVGYIHNELTGDSLLIVDASQIGGWDWSALGPFDVISKDCEKYCYASVNDLID
jgi:hypothetical protein